MRLGRQNVNNRFGNVIGFQFLFTVQQYTMVTVAYNEQMKNEIYISQLLTYRSTPESEIIHINQ